jgi:uncharacterized protein YdeI (YjbR/CyaY-like superfamily)
VTDPIFFRTPGELRRWFEEHADTADELWVGIPKKASGVEGVTWAEAVDEALCVGWIDSVSRPLDDHRRIQRFTPRRPRSIWSDANVAKVERLSREGRMRPAGLVTFERRTAARSGVYSFKQGDIALDADSEAALRAQPDAWAFWERQPPSYRKPAAWWVISAKRPETTAKRLAQLVADSAAGLRVRHLRR